MGDPRVTHGLAVSNPWALGLSTACTATQGQRVRDRSLRHGLHMDYYYQKLMGDPWATRGLL